MRTHLDDSLPLEVLANVAHLSKFHFVRVFEDTTGLSPCRFLSALRIEAAKLLLTKTDLHVTEICMRVGYNSLGTFSRTFHESVGFSPVHFRRLNDATNRLSTRAHDKVKAHDGQNGLPVYLNISRLPENEILLLGAFDHPFAKGKPRAAWTIRCEGEYQLPCVARYLIAIQIHKQARLAEYLLPESPVIARLSLERLAAKEPSHLECQILLRTRKARFFDPPVLIALQLLFSRASTLAPMARSLHQRAPREKVLGLIPPKAKCGLQFGTGDIPSNIGSAISNNGEAYCTKKYQN